MRRKTNGGYYIEIRTVKEGERIRLRWQPPGRPEPTTVQVYLQDKGPKTAVRFHQEKRVGPDERTRMRQHWRNVLQQLQSLGES